MCVLRCALVLTCVLGFTLGSKLEKQTGNISNATSERMSEKEVDHFRIIKRQMSESNITFDKSDKSEALFSKWSSWTRCEDCKQLRMKKCLNSKCHSSRIYEERRCDKKRCKRKARQKEKFRVVQLKQGSRFEMDYDYSTVWSRWSDWIECSDNCRTYRYRVCRKPGRCRKKRQTQSAYCYNINTTCEHFVLSLLNSPSRRMEDLSTNERYHYDNHNQHQRVHWKPKRCGWPYKKASMLKIIGGREAQRYKWPWHVAVINVYREVFCAGTLIAPKWVLTAGHCIRNYLRVRLNEHDLRAFDGREIEMVVHKKYLHPKFNHQTVDNDIAMLKLPKAVKTPVACLPTKPPVPDEICSIMGWGKLDSDAYYGADVLQEATIPVVDLNSCKRSYRHFMLTSNMFCAGWPNGKADTCAGDSGGGLMCRANPKKKRSRYQIQGITSFGDGCGRRNKYGIYTVVYNYRVWIRYNIEHYS